MNHLALILFNVFHQNEIKGRVIGMVMRTAQLREREVRQENVRL